MTNEQKFILQVMDKFVEQKGKGSCYAFKPVKAENIITVFINAHRQKRTDTKILIVTSTYDERLKLKEILEKFNLIDNVTILTKSFINTKYNYIYHFTFLMGCNDDYELIYALSSQSKFTLNVLTEYNTNPEFTSKLNITLPIIKPNISISDLAKDRLNLPVEEMHIGVQISDDDLEQSKKYDEYVATSMSIFGSFENADKCRVGDSVLNISAGQFRYDLARENNWSERLDTTIEFNKQLDEVYNPNALYERANTLYNIIRERLNLLTDNEAKLSKIVELIEKHKNDKIIIVSKRGEFANIIANYINDNTEFLCGEYHDCIPEQYIKDENGNDIVYKSGENKGKRKVFKSKALSTMCLNRFNSSDKTLAINLLSIKNSSDTELKTACDVVIFTSSVCHSPNDFLTRFSNVECNGNKLITYVLYCTDTIEHYKLSDRKLTNNVTIIEEEKNIRIDENNGDVYL